MRAHALLLLLPVLMASACSPQSCDPSQAGFISGIGCEASGSFNQRNQAQQSQLAAARTRALQEDANAAAAQGDATRAQMSLAERRRRVSALDSQIAAARRRLATLQQSNGVDQDRLQRARAAVQNAQAERASVSPQSSGAQLDATQRRLSDILRDM